jgi:hypothetical protein
VNTLKKIEPYLKKIAATQSLAEAQREARLALKIIEKETDK